MTEGATRRRVLVEADGGSRGNPGPAAYGAVLMDADSGEVIAEDGATLGVATNNVAEYHGLIAGLRLASEHAPDAQVEARLDSKLVVEQMSGNWKIKHPDLKPLAARAAEVAPPGTTYTWIPREQNTRADRLVNEALDGLRSGVSAPAADPLPPSRGWAPTSGPPTTLVLVRHGVTAHTVEKRFSGGLRSANPGLSDEGRAQVRATAEWLAPMADQVAAVVTSPVRRTRESAEIVAEVMGKTLVEEPGFAEMEFGSWDGLTFAEVAENFPEDLDRWLGSLDAAPGVGGETFLEVEERVLSGLQRVLDAHAGSTVVVVSHVTPIKMLVAHAVDAPLASVFRMELSPASVSVLAFYTGGTNNDEPRASLRMYNALPTQIEGLTSGQRW